MVVGRGHRRAMSAAACNDGARLANRGAGLRSAADSESNHDSRILEESYEDFNKTQSIMRISRK